MRLWDLTAPPVAEPLVLRSDARFFNDLRFEPSERWLATSACHYFAFWPLGEALPSPPQGA